MGVNKPIVQMVVVSIVGTLSPLSVLFPDSALGQAGRDKVPHAKRAELVEVWSA